MYLNHQKVVDDLQQGLNELKVSKNPLVQRRDSDALFKYFQKKKESEEPMHYNDNGSEKDFDLMDQKEELTIEQQ